MINLLNPSDLREIRAGRLNIRLRNYLLMTVTALLLVGGVYFYGLNQAGNDLSIAFEKNSNATKQLEAYSKVKADAQSYRRDLAMAKKILDNQFMFSDYIDSIASIMPSGTIIDNLTLSTLSLQAVGGKSPATIVPVRAKSYDSILSVKTAFESHTDLFKDVHITATAYSPGDKGKAANYPYTASFTVTILKQKASAQ